MEDFMKLVFLLLMLCAVTSYAGPIEDLKKAYPNASNYEIMEKLYKTSTMSAQFSDFDVFDKTSNMKCAAVTPDNRLVTSGPIKTYNYVYEVGHPSQGPLIPAVPDKTRKVLVASELESFQARQYLEVYAAVIEMSSTPTDLIEKVSRTPNGMHMTSGSLPTVIYYRKNADLISMRQTAGRSGRDAGYGYCWRE
jgi:hypothetical protein